MQSLGLFVVFFQVSNEGLSIYPEPNVTELELCTRDLAESLKDD